MWRLQTMHHSLNKPSKPISASMLRNCRTRKDAFTAILYMIAHRSNLKIYFDDPLPVPCMVNWLCRLRWPNLDHSIGTL